MTNEELQNLVNEYAMELGQVHSNLVIERSQRKKLRAELDRTKKELEELKSKQQETIETEEQ